MQELWEEIRASEKITENEDELAFVHPISITPFEMAYKFYNRMWKQAQTELAYLVQRDQPPDEPPEIVPERMVLVRRASKLYLQYIKATNKLIKCYENIAQPQKRMLLRKMMDASIGRVLELKQDLVKLENSEFQFLDQMLLSLRMTPKDMNIKIPEHFKDIPEEGKERRIIVESCLESLLYDDKKKYFVTEKKKYVKMAMFYIRLIQAQERTRQARETFREYQKKYLVKELNKLKEARKDEHISKSRQSAAITIQRAWRLRMLRKSLNKEYLNEMGFLRMLPTPADDSVKDIEKDRLYVIKRNMDNFLKARDTIKAEMLTYEVPEMIEKLEDKIRSYFHSYFEIFGIYPEFPTEEEGGSIKLFETSLDFDVEDKGTTADETKIESQKDTKSEKSSKDTKGKDGKDKGSEPEVPEGYSLQPSKYLPDLVVYLEEYKTVWKDKAPINYDRFDYDMLKKDILKDVELEVQLVVDEKMRIELTRLAEAFQKDTKKKPKKAKKGKKGKDKGKKGKKGRKEKDLTPDRSTESLIEELVRQGIIVSYPKCSLSDFKGDYNYSGSLEHMDADPHNDPMPCLGDIRRVVNEYCILPMGSEYIHSKGAYVKSVLIAGPKGVGKKSLIYAVCTEINATMMDLSAENIEGKYPGKEGKEMLLHLILKVGRLLQPTVIFIREAENYFYKKKPATCTLSEPTRLKKDLPKFLKSIRDEDRIIICGTTVFPFDVDLKGLGGSYNKVLCILKPDYNCRRCLWREMILQNKGILSRKLDVSVLCNVSDGFTAAVIKDTVKQVLTRRRLACQEKIPLNVTDFLPNLARHVPVYEEEITAYKQWLEKMPMRKKRVALLQTEGPEVEEEDESEEED